MNKVTKFSKAALTLLAVALLLSTGCKNTSTNTLVADPAYTYTTEQDSTIKCSYEVDYPQQSDELAMGVKQFIAQKLADIYLPYNNDDVDLKEYPLFKGDVQQCDSLVKHYAEGTKRYFAAQQKEMIKEFTESEWIPRFSYEVSVKKQIDTLTYITYGVSQSVYMGGAHGSYSYAETTISKRTCRPLVQTVDTTQVMQMQSLLRNGIISYLKDNGVENAETNYKDQLFLPEDGHFPLPVNTPSLTKNGVSFVYQQYEIASYAVGLVSFTIPYDKIMPYLCEEAKELVETK